MSAPEGMVPLKELPVDYSAEQAEADGCYGEYFANYERITFGEEKLLAFRECVQSGILSAGYPVCDLYSLLSAESLDSLPVFCSAALYGHFCDWILHYLACCVPLRKGSQPKA